MLQARLCDIGAVHGVTFEPSTIWADPCCSIWSANNIGKRKERRGSLRRLVPGNERSPIVLSDETKRKERCVPGDSICRVTFKGINASGHTEGSRHDVQGHMPISRKLSPEFNPHTILTQRALIPET